MRSDSFEKIKKRVSVGEKFLKELNEDLEMQDFNYLTLDEKKNMEKELEVFENDEATMSRYRLFAFTCLTIGSFLLVLLFLQLSLDAWIIGDIVLSIGYNLVAIINTFMTLFYFLMVLEEFE